MTFLRCFTEADTAKIEITHVSALATTLVAATNHTRLVLRVAHRPNLD